MSYEEYRHHILNVAPANEAPGHYYSLRSFEDGRKFGIPEAHVRQIVTEMCEHGLISLAVFDGQRECTLQEWRSRRLDDQDFFLNQTLDGNQVRVRLLARGAELQKRAIGFSA